MKTNLFVKKSTAVILLAFILLGTFTGCGNDVTPTEPETEAVATDAVTEALETEAPVVETEVAETEVVETEAPETEAPETEAPETEAPETDASETEVPVTDAPETEVPVTDVPETEAPVTDASETDASETDAPETEAPVTDAPVAEPTISAEDYTVKGGKAQENGSYYTTESLTYTFKDKIGKGFNCYTVYYTASTDMRAEVTYAYGNSDKTETIYLERGENKSFRCLIEGYLDKKTAGGIESIVITPINGTVGEFTLTDVTTESREVLSGSIVYMTNERYKVGIRLSWGGGITYIEDFGDGISKLTNLVNQHDTGRLIQQSYYGIQGYPYEATTWAGALWCYNPVQGGDTHNNQSRLIDYEISDDGLTIYVKCQPLDWSKNNSLTISYMENTYSLNDKGIKVDNRFVDFSGYTHRRSRQELPAFYTVSYLSEFVYYAGDGAWTGGALTYEKNLPFWGSTDKCYYYPKGSENWCAWQDANGYGIGLYSPICDVLAAGRYLYDGSMHSKSDSTSYVSPQIYYTMTSFVPFEYSYYITTGQTEEIRQTFYEIYQSNN